MDNEEKPAVIIEETGLQLVADNDDNDEAIVLRPTSTNKGRKNSVVIGVVVAVVVIAIAAICFWFFQFKLPHDEAVASYTDAAHNYSAAITALEDRNAELEQSIDSLQSVISSEDQPLDDTLLTTAGAIIGEAQGAKADVPKLPEMPEETDAINDTSFELVNLTEELGSQGNYAELISKLTDAQQTLENSIQQMKQVTNPTEQFVIARIEGLPNVVGVQAVTEDNDPNGHLNKQGGYTATVYFSSDLVDRSRVSGSDIVDQGTDGGGAIEVYKTVEEAEARNTYLAAFDGGILASGSHVVCGTVLIRTSNYLTASQQQALEKNISEALIRID
jgi:prefoldin subunit 5